MLGGPGAAAGRITKLRGVERGLLSMMESVPQIATDDPSKGPRGETMEARKPRDLVLFRPRLAPTPGRRIGGQRSNGKCGEGWGTRSMIRPLPCPCGRAIDDMDCVLCKHGIKFPVGAGRECGTTTIALSLFHCSEPPAQPGIRLQQESWMVGWAEIWPDAIILLDCHHNRMPQS